YGSEREEVFLGYSMGQQKEMSEQTASRVDAEVRHIVESAYSRARKTLTEYKHELEALAKALLEYETLSGDEIPRVLKGEKLVRESADDAETERRKSLPSGSMPAAGGADFGA